MSKGDAISVHTLTPGKDGLTTFEVTASSNGATVDVSYDRAWVTLTELSKAGGTIRTVKVKPDHVLAVVEKPARAQRGS